MTLTQEAETKLAAERREMALTEVKHLLGKIIKAQNMIESWYKRIAELEDGAEPLDYDLDTGDRFKR